jgi:hypothetical protein
LNCFCGVPSTYSNAAYEEIMEMVEDLLELKKMDNVVESTRNSDDEISTKA